MKDWSPVDFFVELIILYHIPAWVCSSSKSLWCSVSSTNKKIIIETHYFQVDTLNFCSETSELYIL